MNTSEEMIPVGIDMDGTSLYIGDTVVTAKHKNMPPEYVGFRFRIDKKVEEGDLSFVDIMNLAHSGLTSNEILIATCLDADHGEANDIIVPKTVRKEMAS